METNCAKMKNINTETSIKLLIQILKPSHKSSTPHRPESQAGLEFLLELRETKLSNRFFQTSLCRRTW